MLFVNLCRPAGHTVFHDITTLRTQQKPVNSSFRTEKQQKIVKVVGGVPNTVIGVVLVAVETLKT
jgi:hypothetical protein